jgi:hypothetical protein
VLDEVEDGRVRPRNRRTAQKSSSIGAGSGAIPSGSASRATIVSASAMPSSRLRRRSTTTFGSAASSSPTADRSSSAIGYQVMPWP